MILLVQNHVFLCNQRPQLGNLLLVHFYQLLHTFQIDCLVSYLELLIRDCHLQSLDFVLGSRLVALSFVEFRLELHDNHGRSQHVVVNNQFAGLNRLFHVLLHSLHR